MAHLFQDNLLLQGMSDGRTQWSVIKSECKYTFPSIPGLQVPKDKFPHPCFETSLQLYLFHTAGPLSLGFLPSQVVKVSVHGNLTLLSLGTPIGGGVVNVGGMAGMLYHGRSAAIENEVAAALAVVNVTAHATVAVSAAAETDEDPSSSVWQDWRIPLTLINARTIGGH